MGQRSVPWTASNYTPTCQDGNAHSPTLGINHVLMFVRLTDKNQYLILIHICLVLSETEYFYIFSWKMTAELLSLSQGRGKSFSFIFFLVRPCDKEALGDWIGSLG